MSEHGGNRQALVDEVFRSCMERDRRFREDMVRDVKEELARRNQEAEAAGEPMPFPYWQPTDYDLRVALSRTASRPDEDGHPRFMPAYEDPRRYVSLERVEHLVEKADAGEITEDETSRLLSMLADLRLAEDHWARKVERAKGRLEVLRHLIVRAETSWLDLGDSLQTTMEGV